MAVTCRANSLPACTVFNSTLKEGLAHCTSERVMGSSRLLTMRNTLVSLVVESLARLKDAMVGVMSMGFQTVPVICRMTLDRPGSVHETVADLVTIPPKLAELNCSGIRPVLPGSTFLSHVPAVVQPQPGRTSVISRVEVPVFVKMKSCRTSSPELTFPKL